MSFDQNAYAPDGSAAAISMGATGYAYVPPACASGTACRLMVALHGCLQGAGSVGTTFAHGGAQIEAIMRMVHALGG